MAKLHLIESRHDIEIAKNLVDELQSLGHVVTWDINYLVPGVEWKRSLKEAIVACDGLVVVLTENCVELVNGVSWHIVSQWMAADIGTARAYGKFIIPVLMGKEVNIPALVDDIFTIIERNPDKRAIIEIAKKIDFASELHIKSNQRILSLDLPEGYQHLASAVLSLQQQISFEKSVFVMMKFPDSSLDGVQNKMLEEIWEVLSKVLQTYGLTARRADKRTFHDQMWENIIIYMLGCKYGIAILEDRAAQELNPNVTLEYGFMKALNRKVVLFRDINFRHSRADLTGKLAKSFEIDGEGKLNKITLEQAVRDWLLDEGISPIFRV